MFEFKNFKSCFSFERPAHLLAWFLSLSGALWVIQTSLLQKILPLDVVEAVVWGNQMQWGQMKSPPLSGWLAATFWHLSGGGDWALYLLAELMILLGLWFVYKLAREFINEYESSIAVLLLCFIFYYNPPAMKFCSHDTLIAILPAMTLYFVRAYKNDRLTDWLLLAVFSALGVLGKYAAIQLLLAYAVIALCTSDGRKRLRSYKPYLCAGVFFLLLSPHIYWLIQHDFLSILHMRGRLETDHKWYQFLINTAILLYPYISCFGILAGVCFIWNKRQRKCSESQKANLSLLLPAALIPPGIYVILSACGGATVDQWFSYFAYLSGITTVILWPYQCGRTEFKRLFLIAAGVIIILLAATSIDVMIKPRLRIHSEPQDIVKAGETFWQRHSVNGQPLKVVYGDRWLCGVMELYSTSAPAACDDDDICSWELARERAQKNGVMIIYRKSRPKSLPLLPHIDVSKLSFSEYVLEYRALGGKTRRTKICFGYLPPDQVCAPAGYQK